jgi:hypothetical protein
VAFVVAAFESLYSKGHAEPNERELFGESAGRVANRQQARRGAVPNRHSGSFNAE